MHWQRALVLWIHRYYAWFPGKCRQRIAHGIPWSDQGTVLRSLRAYGPTAKPLLPAIEPLLDSKLWMLQVPAAAALWAIDGRTNSVPVLVRQLEGQQQPGNFGFFS